MFTSLHVAAMVTFLVLLFWAAEGAPGADAPATSPLSPSAARIEQIAAMLSAEPAGMGRPATDRQAWEAIGKASAFKDVIADAEKNLAAPIPVLTEDDFTSYEKTGRREQYDKAFRAFTGRIRKAVHAECIENRGRFVGDIELVVKRLCELPTWVPPYHNEVLNRDANTTNIVDLVSSDVAAMLATADYWLGDKLSDETRQQVRREVARRVLHPVRNKVEGGPGRHIWWLEGTNNWNSVCTANVVIAAMALLPERNERAYYIAAAEKLIQHYLKGFTPDGYCSEGLGYWNYGFGYYVLLSDVVYQATGGKLDWMTDPLVRKVATFGLRTEILPGVYPCIADARPDVRPMPNLQNYIAKKYGLDLQRRRRTPDTKAMRAEALQDSVYAFPYGLATPLPAGDFKVDQAREWFPDAQFYVGRPGGETPSLAVAIKGGHNNEHHNHNDVGTYMVAVGDQTPLVDPGAPVYTRETFSHRRYQDNMINSWGHPVPLIDGKLQSTGAQAKATLLSKKFTDGEDTLVFDIKAAYGVPAIKSLTRTFVYSRKDAGSLTVTDEAKFSTPSRFGTTLISYGDWEQKSDGSLLIKKGENSVLVTIDTKGKPYDVHQERIQSETPKKTKPLRLGIDLVRPVKSARISVRITPANQNK